MFSFGHCPNEGGGRPLPELKNTIYIFIFDGRKRCTSCPKEGEGEGGSGNSGNARKKTLFFLRSCSLSYTILIHKSSSFCNFPYIMSRSDQNVIPTCGSAAAGNPGRGSSALGSLQVPSFITCPCDTFNYDPPPPPPLLGAFRYRLSPTQPTRI